MTDPQAVDRRNLIIRLYQETARGGINHESQVLALAAFEGPEYLATIKKAFDDLGQAPLFPLAESAGSSSLSSPSAAVTAKPELAVAPPAAAVPAKPSSRGVTRREWQSPSPSPKPATPPKPAEEPAEEPLPAAASSFLPSTQPRIVAKPVRFGSERPATDGAPALLSQMSPYDTAKEYARRHCFKQGVLATYYWQGEFWEWNGRHYEAVAPEAMRDRVYAFLDSSQRIKDAELARFRPTPRNVNDVLDGLKSGLSLDAKWQPPMWLDSGVKAADVLVFRNGLVNVMTGERLPATPKLWVHGAVDYDWQPEAGCPVWEAFLAEVFPGDLASQHCIEELLGYAMTEETKFQKGALWVGPKRSGKGTIAFVLRKLVGDGAYVGLSFSTWVSHPNSKENLIGKKAAVFPDVRFKPGKQYGANYDPGGIGHTSAELLLNIIGEDAIEVGRKYLKPWNGQLRAKIILISNEVPNLNDVSGVLPSRFIKIAFNVSFFGREDVDLRDKLARELPGIAGRCLAGYRRLIARGRFVQPESGRELEQTVQAQADPYAAMVQECFVVDPKGEVKVDFAFLKFQDWCRESGRYDLLRSTPRNLLTQQLKKVPGLEALRTIKPHGSPRVYVGLRVKTKADREAELDRADRCEPHEPH